MVSGIQSIDLSNYTLYPIVLSTETTCAVTCGWIIQRLNSSSNSCWDILHISMECVQHRRKQCFINCDVLFTFIYDISSTNQIYLQEKSF